MSTVGGVSNQPSTTNTQSGSSSSNNTIAGNFTTFLQLLTTQLQNQSPLDPLDTNQFTAQLVQFSQVEQQLKMNDQLTTLISMQKTTQDAGALNFIGKNVTVDGSTAQLTDSAAQWSFTATKPAKATITITNATGQTVYSGDFTMQAGPQNFTWDGRGNNGVQWPDGAYTMKISAKDASGQNVAVSTEVQGTVDSVDLTTTPPTVTIGGQQYSADKIKKLSAGSQTLSASTIEQIKQLLAG